MASGSVLADFVAGWTSGVVGLLVSHPLDTVKVRLQSRSVYEGAIQCIKQTLLHESVGGFYKGMGAPLVMAGFLHSTFFLGYSSTLSVMDSLKVQSSQKTEHTLGVLLMASVAGAFLQWIPSCPIEVIKTRLQVQRENIRAYKRLLGLSSSSSSPSFNRVAFIGPVDCIGQIWRHNGLSGLYRGGLTMLARDAIGFCFYLPVYELTLRRLTRSDGGDHSRLWAPMLAGGVAGVACWWSILPLDVVKSRLQADTLTSPKYRGFWHCTVDTYRTEGWTAFTKGWHVSALRGFPACACLFLVYDETLRMINWATM